MTTSTWDKSEIEKQFSECRTFKEIITHLESEFSVRGEVICEIRLNGKTLREEEESGYAQNPREDISDLSVTTEHPKHLILEALTSSLGYLPKVRDAAVSTADAFRGADLRLAQQKFAETVESCQWVVDTIHSIRGAAEGIGLPLTDQVSWLKAEVSLTKVVNEVLDAYQKQDLALLADLLEYELHNGLEEWTSVLRNEFASREVAA